VYNIIAIVFINERIREFETTKTIIQLDVKRQKHKSTIQKLIPVYHWETFAPAYHNFTKIMK
jgi:hypothetical protein